MRSYLYIARIRMISNLAYRFDVVIGILVHLVMLLTMIFLWRAVYTGKDVVAGVNESQMITYSILAALLRIVQEVDVQYIIVEKVVSGQIAVDFLKPINLLLSWMSDDIGNNLSSLLLALPPIAFVAAVFFKPVIYFSFVSFLLFAIALVLSFLIMWVMFAIVGLMAFWFMELGYLGIVQEQVIRILSGAYIPLWFFPGWAQNVSRFLPFQYVGQFSISILIGKLTVKEIVTGIIIQAVWLAVFTLILYLVWEKAKRHVLVQGG